MTQENFNIEELKNIAKEAIDLAKKIGATAGEAHVSGNCGFSIQVRNQQTEELVYHRNRALGITLYNGQRRGNVTTADFTPSAIKMAVEAAWTIAKQTDSDPYAGLPDEHLMATNFPNLQLYHPWHLSTEDAVMITKKCEALALAASPHITKSEGSNLSTQEDCNVYANSYGFCHGEVSTYHSLSCTVIAEKNDAMQRDYSYMNSLTPLKATTTEEVAKEAAARVVRKLGAQTIPTQKTSVIFAADVARSLLSHFLSAITGSAIYRKTSFLVDNLDKQIFPEFIRIDERPYLPATLGSAAYDAEGVATRAQDFISEGKLTRYLLNSYTARHLGMETTANAGGAHNLFISHENFSLAQLQKKMQRGLLVTELLGHGVNLLTGDYSRGAAGFWIENGEIAFPVEGITIAGNLKNMFRGIQAVGNDIETRGNILTGSIWIDEMMIGGS